MNQAILGKIQEAKDTLNQEFGITKIAIFGSYARNEENEDSDIDIVILDMRKKNGLLVVRAKNFLQTYLDKNIDIGFYSSMNPFIKNRIKKEMIYV